MHLVIIFPIALIIFGPGKLSKVGGSLGKATRYFKKSMKDVDDEPAKSSGTKKAKIKK